MPREVGLSADSVFGARIVWSFSLGVLIGQMPAACWPRKVVSGCCSCDCVWVYVCLPADGFQAM